MSLVILQIVSVCYTVFLFIGQSALFSIRREICAPLKLTPIRIRAQERKLLLLAKTVVMAIGEGWR